MSTETQLPGLAETLALRLLASAALAIAIVCLLILPSGPHESDETLSWLLALVLAVPLGFYVAMVQERLLAMSSPAAAARGVAAGTVLLTLAFMLRRIGSGNRLDHAIVLAAAVGSLLAPLAAARIWRRPDDRESVPAAMIAALWLAALAFVFIPSHALRPSNLVPALVLAAFLSCLLLRLPRRRLADRWRRALDAVICVVLVFAVVQLPPLSGIFVPTLVYHQGFFLGPINDVLGGRAMLGGAWSQYGVGLIDALAGVFTVVPIGFGTLMLIVLAATAAEYVCVYAVLRLAGLSQVLVVVTVVVAAAGNLFSPLAAYLFYPSAGPIRFGLPYLIVLAAVLAARYPSRRGVCMAGGLAVVATGAVWSLETFIYCAATYGCVVLVEALAAGPGVIRRVVRGAALGATVSAAAIAIFSLVTLALDGRLDWGPYFEYLQLYTSGELGALPVVIFSAGPLMGAAIFFTAVTVLWLVRRYPGTLEPPVRNALAGFTGLALGTFTYYLGRSHPNNLLVIMVPAIAISGLWVHVAMQSRTATWRTVAIAAFAFGWAMIAVAAWPSVKEKWHTTALALAVPHQGGSLRLQLDEYADNPAFDPLAPIGVAMLARHLPPHVPALVLTHQDLTTEILVRAGRRNLLPISHPPEDVIISSSFGRVEESAEHVPAGTLLLTSPAPSTPGGLTTTDLPIDFNELQVAALDILHRRFRFALVEGSPGGLELVRLVPRPAA